MLHTYITIGLIWGMVNTLILIFGLCLGIDLFDIAEKSVSKCISTIFWYVIIYTIILWPISILGNIIVGIILIKECFE